MQKIFLLQYYQFRYGLFWLVMVSINRYSYNFLFYVMQYCGEKISGDGRGRTIGFPTINCTNITGKIFLESGVFATRVQMEGQENFFSGLVHVGSRPTFDADEFRVEIYLFDFDQMLEDGEKIYFTLEKKIRGVQKFSGVEQLVSQIKQDVSTAKLFFLL